MASSSQRKFVDWEERFVSHDRGSRVVHYFLRDRHGHQCLAVIGTERSLRHMVYVVCDDFLPLCGLDKSTTSAFKWRARREVVDWLSAFTKSLSSEAALSAGSPHNGLNSSTDTNSSYSHDGTDGLESGQEECRSHHQDNDPRKQCSVSKADVVWVGSAWSCRKRLRHFNSFRRNGITISDDVPDSVHSFLIGSLEQSSSFYALEVQNFVYVMTEEKDRHVAYVEDLFEDKKLRKKLRVRWFHKISELTCRIPPPAPHGREVFFTTFQQDLSVECVDGVATVLSPAHHDICLATLPENTSGQTLLCYRQFGGEGIKPFSLQEVKGYWRQPILALAGIVDPLDNSLQPDQRSEDLEMDEEEADLTSLIRRSRTARCSRRRTGLGNKMMGRSTGDAAGDGSCISSEAGGSGSGDPPTSGERSQGSGHDQELWRYDVGDHIEVLSEDSGLRGCWYKGTVVKRAGRRLKVSYDDITSEEGEGNLEEWISSCKVSGPDEFRVRIDGRPSIRPCTSKSASLVRLNEGEVVDGWWNDGWWEGIICGKESSGVVDVFLTGEMEYVTLKPTELRVSKEWLNGTWAAIPSYPDLLSLFGRSVPKEATEERNETERSLQEAFGSSLSLDNKICSLPHKGARTLIAEAVDQSHSGHDCNGSARECEVLVKEESGGVPGTFGEQEEQNSSSPSAIPGSPRSAGHSPIRVVFRQSQQDRQDDGAACDVKQNRPTVSGVSSKPSGIGLKWKASRKRHRQGDLMTSRVDRMKGCIMDTLKEEGSSDGDNVESTTTEDVENLHRWKTGDGEEIIKHKKHRKGNDNSLKALHGAPMGSSLFIGSLPIANLVMSR